MKTEIVKEITLKLEPERVWNSSVATIMRSLPKMDDEITHQIENILLDNIVSASFTNPGIPDDNNEAYISSIYTPENISLNWKELSDFGPGLLSLPFTLNVDAEIEFFVYRGNAFEVPEGVWVEVGDPEKHHYFDAEGTVTLDIQGSLALHVDPSNLPEEGVPELIKVSLHKVDNIDVIEQEPGLIFHVYKVQ